MFSLTAALEGITFGLQQTGKWDLSLTFFAILWFALLNTIIFSISLLGFGRNDKMFMKAFYTGTYLQLFLSLSGVLIYLIFSKEKNKAFIVSYLLLYVFYTAFEIYHLVTTLRSVSKKTQTIEK
jgi:hypothetical protein